MLLVGAGTHAARLVTLFDLRDKLTAFVSAERAPWLNEPALGDKPLKRYEFDQDAITDMEPGIFVMGIGGVRPEQLAKRRALAEHYEAAGWQPAFLQDVSALIHPKAVIQKGVHVMNGAIVSPHAILRHGCLVNCGAIVEHHAMIGRGTHVAPGAVILGSATIGDDCMIGANATVIEGTKVPDGTMVKANTVWKIKDPTVCPGCGCQHHRCACEWMGRT